MENNADFARLEAVVEKLVDKLNVLKKENGQLHFFLMEKEQKIENLEGEITALHGDQQNISNRVSTLLSSIEDWENSENETDAGSRVEASPAVDDGAGDEDDSQLLTLDDTPRT